MWQSMRRQAFALQTLNLFKKPEYRTYLIRYNDSATTTDSWHPEHVPDCEEIFDSTGPWQRSHRNDWSNK